MKQCSVCKEKKPCEAYNKKRSRKDGLQTHCRECSHKKFAAYYNTNKAEHLKTIRAQKKEQIKKSRAYVLEYLSRHVCVDCGNDDPLVLEFDHVRGSKSNNVSNMIANGTGLKKLQVEIDKCEIRCANCHRHRTHKNNNSYRVQSSTG